MGKKGKWAVARSLGFQRIDSVGDKTKASRGVEIDSFETIGFGTMPMGDETGRAFLTQGSPAWLKGGGGVCVADKVKWDGGEKLRVVGLWTALRQS